MKRFIYCLAIFGITLIGCNPMEDIYDGLDTSADPIVGNETYTLTSDDYDELGLTFGSFNSIDDAKDALPAFLAEKYPFWGEGSSVVVGYNLYVGSAEGISDYSGADVYTLSNSDYAFTGSDAFGFYPDVDATSQIPNVLANQIASPVEGQIVLAEYKQYFEDPVVGLANLVEYDFNGSFEGWTIQEEFGGNDVWTSLTGYVQGNGYFGGQVENVEWLVSPSIDLTGEDNLKFQISQAIRFAGDLSLLKILVSTDYSGDVATATWDEINLAIAPAGDSDTMFLSEDYDFSAYDDETINIAFKYESTNSDAARWRIESLAIKTLGAAGETDSKGEYFMYSGGTWEAVDGVYFLSSSDYDSMGTASGQPGQYNNFSSSTPADSYIPTFLGIEYPYAQEEDQLIVIYKYYSSSAGATQTRGNEYTYLNGEWMPHQTTIATTLQFGFENGVWIPDNTIRYTMTDSDYAVIVAELADTYPAATASMSNYGNMDRRPGNVAEWTNPMVLAAINVVLDNIAPSAEEEQKYIVTIDVYNGSNTTEDFAVIKMGGEWVYQN